MPVSFFSPHEIILSIGTQSQVTVTTTPTDIDLTSCTLTMAGSFLNRVTILAAYLEMTCAVEGSTGATAFAASQFLDVCPDGTNYYSAIALTNLCTIDPAPRSHFADIMGNFDISQYVIAAVASAHDITFRIPQATATVNNLLLFDVCIRLHLIIA